MGIRKFKAHAQYCFCNKCGLEKLKKSTEVFEKATGIKVRKVYRNKDAHNPVFYIDVNNRALAVFILSAERLLRKEIVCGNVPKKIALRYVKGLVEGDGSLNLKMEDGKVLGMHLRVFESEDDAVNDLLVLADKLLGIRLSKYQSHEQQASIDLNDLLELLLNDVVPARFIDRVKERILIAFQRKGLPWILMKLAESFKDAWFSSTEASKAILKVRHHTLEALKALEARGYLISKKMRIYNKTGCKGTPIRRLFRITEKGKRLVALLSSLFPFFPNIPLLLCLLR